jgi:TPR repeat protein
LAQYSYARCLANGRGVPLDLKRAAEYYELCARQNFGRPKSCRAALPRTAGRPLRTRPSRPVVTKRPLN